jgi:hypothetical protein
MSLLDKLKKFNFNRTITPTREPLLLGKDQCLLALTVSVVFIIEKNINLVTQTSYLNGEVNCTKPSFS